MGILGNLFEKKICDVCGEEIKLLGNRKLEDGNLCKNCASKLSPWFDERRHSTVDQIKEQLAYREANQSKVSSFRGSQVYGQGSQRLYVDTASSRFTVASDKDLSGGNPDILDFSQATACELDIKENKHEEKRTVDGKSVSYVPPRYKYSYDFYVTIRVNNPYFDEMKFKLNSSSVDTGNTCMTGNGGATAGWKVSTANILNNVNINKYNEYISNGDQIKSMIYGWMGRTVQPMQQGFNQQPMMNQGYSQQPMQQGFNQQPMMNQGYPQQGMQQGFNQQPMQQAAAPAAAMAGAAVTAGAQMTCPFCDAVMTPVGGKCPICEGVL